MMIVILAGTVGLNFWLFTIIPKGFFPEQDTGRLFGFIQADQSISFQRMSQKLRQYIDIVQATRTSTTSSDSTAAGGGAATPASMFISLKPLGQRKASSEQIIARLRPKLAQVAGRNALHVPAAGDPRRAGGMSNSLYQYTLQADNLAGPAHLDARSCSRRSRPSPSSPTSIPTSRTRGSRPTS